jgi:hypothetical protein
VQEAIGQFRRLLEDRTRVQGPDHPDTLTTRKNLADWLGQAGQVRVAIAEFGPLLEDQARVLDPEHPATLRTRRDLAYWEEMVNRRGGCGN